MNIGILEEIRIMNKTDLIEVIAEDADLSKAAAGRILDKIILLV